MVYKYWIYKYRTMNSLRPKNLLFAGFATACTALSISPAEANPPKSARPPAPDKRLNVLFIMADQWRAQAMGYAGDPNVKTPNMDAFAAKNLNFTTAVTAQPISSPYRACLISGQFSTTNGMLTNDLPFHPDGPTLGELFKAAGYMTGYIGKWHLNGGDRLAFIPPQRRFGFDYWKVMNCTHQYNRSYYWPEYEERMLWPGYDAFAQADSAMVFMAEAAKTKKPFCMMLSWGPPHDPYGIAPEEFRKMYNQANIVLRENVPTDQAAKWRADLAGYYAHISALDHKFGEIVARLEELGLMDNTIIVFTADHGDMLGGHGYEKKSHPQDESIRVPFLMHLPGAKARVIDEPLTTPDILPTLLDLCGIAIPGSVQGRDFRPLVEGKVTTLGDAALVIWPLKRLPYGLNEYRCVRTMRYTYAEELTGPWLMFDNETDPYQMNNLVGKKGYEALQAALKAKLYASLKAANDTFKDETYYARKFGVRVAPQPSKAAQKNNE